MELTYVTIVVLALMVFVLSGMIGYLYWQQTRMLQHLQSLALALATHVENTKQQEVLEEAEAEAQEEEEEDDDRVSVREKVEVVDGPPAIPNLPATPVDIDDLQDKTAVELRDLLTKKGIPFGKRDSKNVLIQLLKATS
jgi:hypothetical protein